MPMNRPTAAELIEAVREYLERKVQPGLTGAAVYENVVAINALKILAREAETGARSLAQEHDRLSRLLGSDASVMELNSELCTRIAAGDFDARRGELFGHLYRSTLDKLAVDNPRYAAYRRALARTGSNQVEQA